MIFEKTGTRTLALAALLPLVLASTAEAGGAKKRQWFDAESWEKGKADGVVVTRERGVVVGPARTRLALDDAAQVWCLAQVGDAILAGTGASGQIWKVGPDKASLFAETGALVVTDIARVGTVTYAATIPEGRIYRVTDRGEVAVHCKLDDPYVWRLAPAADGAFYAATGPSGKVWKIDQNGAAQVFYQSFEKNVLALRTDAAGNVFLGGAPEAQLVRVGPDGKGTILCDFDAAELRDLIVTPEGVVCALNGAEKEAETPAGDEAAAGAEDEKALALPGVPAAPKAAAAKKEPAGAAAGPLADLGGGAKGGRVVRLGPNGIERLLEREAGSISALARDARGWIYAASGPDGRVTRVRGTEQEVWADLDEKNVLALLEKEGNLVAVGTGDGAAVYKLAGRPTEIDEDESPSWRSEVLDAGTLAKWGRLQATVLGEAEGSGASKEKPTPGVTFQVRTGNTKDPEKGGWSEWKDAAPNAAVPAGETPTRFLQVRAAWKRPKARLRELSLYYRPLNRKPRIAEITVRGGLGEQLDLSGQLQALGAELEVDGRQGAGGAGAELGALVGPAKKTPAGGGAARSPSNPVRVYAKQISWKADDPDGDHLVYRVYVRRVGEESWTRLHERESWGRPDFTWLTESFPDGSYQVKVVASDSPDNPPAADGGAGALEAERIAGPFLVDNHPPTVELKVADGKVTGTAVDSASAIARLEFSVDGSPWKQVAPADGVLDSREESFLLPLPELKAGRHVVSVRALDEAGNTGAASVDVDGAR